MCQRIQNGTTAEISWHSENNEIGDWDYDDAKEISSFIQVIHHNCKNLGIHSEIVPTWIRDLLDCYSYILDNSAQTSDRNFLK